MKTRQPTWTLKGTCPVCQQGSCLVLVCCKACGHLAAVCDEERSAFIDARQISVALACSEDTTCVCGKQKLGDFELASGEQILASGLSASDYE